MVGDAASHSATSTDGVGIRSVSVPIPTASVYSSTLRGVNMPFKVEGIDYTSEGILELHKAVADLRLNLLFRQEMEDAVMLSHALALLFYLAELIQEKEAVS